jgi:hypothetical protein
MAGWIHQKLGQDGGGGPVKSGNDFWQNSIKAN